MVVWFLIYNVHMYNARGLNGRSPPRGVLLSFPPFFLSFFSYFLFPLLVAPIFEAVE